MKNTVTPPNQREGQKRGSSPSPASTKGAVTITCGFCKNTFFAVPRNAVCLKCKRPANQPLSALMMLLILIIFPFGLLQAALLRPSRPYASRQALLISLVGAAICAAIYLLIIK